MKSLFLLGALIDPNSVGVPKTDASGLTVWQNILNTAYFFAGVVVIFVLIYAGIRYIIARGKEDNIIKAKNTIIYAISGLIIILLAAAITNFVLGSFSK